MGKLITPSRNIILPPLPPVGVSGHFKIDIGRISKSGKESFVEVMPLGPNMITDAGLDMIGNRLFSMQACHVGSGSSSPAVTNTNLQNYIAGTTTGLSDGQGWVNNNVDTRYGWRRRTLRFGQGAAAGNLAEVGMATAAASTRQLFSRARILDTLGVPTVITVTAMDFLDVTYELRWHYPIGVMDLGNHSIGGTVRNIKAAASGVGVPYSFASGWELQSLPLIGGMNSHAQYSINAAAVMAAETAQLGTANFPGSSMTELAYVAGTYSKVRRVVADITMFNGTIGRLGWGLMNMPFQYTFDPPIVKTNTQQLTLEFRVSWARL